MLQVSSSIYTCSSSSCTRGCSCGNPCSSKQIRTAAAQSAQLMVTAQRFHLLLVSNYICIIFSNEWILEKDLLRSPTRRSVKAPGAIGIETSGYGTDACETSECVAWEQNVKRLLRIYQKPRFHIPPFTRQTRGFQ